MVAARTTGSAPAAWAAAAGTATRNDKADGDPRYLVERIPAAGRPVASLRDSLIRLTGRNDLGDAGIDGIVLVTDDVLDRDTVEYYGANVGSMNEMGMLQRTLRQAVLLEKLTRAGIDPTVMMGSVKPIEMTTEFQKKRG